MFVGTVMAKGDTFYSLCCPQCYFSIGKCIVGVWMRSFVLSHEHKRSDTHVIPLRYQIGWTELHLAIRDILVDLADQGIFGETTMPIAAKNDIDLLIKKIEGDNYLLKFEAGRNRSGYLRMRKCKASIYVC
ncbi:hypothetical protein [Pectobacterium cacticida]|uniref:hypothetical protein n=1 Tax=Pectobacterium cacticida TaxID=69221 RepID=UPI0039876087